MTRYWYFSMVKIAQEFVFKKCIRVEYHSLPKISASPVVYENGQ